MLCSPGMGFGMIVVSPEYGKSLRNSSYICCIRSVAPISAFAVVSPTSRPPSRRATAPRSSKAKTPPPAGKGADLVEWYMLTTSAAKCVMPRGTPKSWTCTSTTWLWTLCATATWVKGTPGSSGAPGFTSQTATCEASVGTCPVMLMDRVPPRTPDRRFVSKKCATVTGGATGTGIVTIDSSSGDTANFTDCPCNCATRGPVALFTSRWISLRASKGPPGASCNSTMFCITPLTVSLLKQSPSAGATKSTSGNVRLPSSERSILTCTLSYAWSLKTKATFALAVDRPIAPVTESVAEGIRLPHAMRMSSTCKDMGPKPISHTVSSTNLHSPYSQRGTTGAATRCKSKVLKPARRTVPGKVTFNGQTGACPPLADGAMTICEKSFSPEAAGGMGMSAVSAPPNAALLKASMKKLMARLVQSTEFATLNGQSPDAVQSQSVNCKRSAAGSAVRR
mmetsp:Transcript_55246/g.167947  ORF Transcript_55246/g.167947 Transcript_55246/m.167947 type:complete len:452 (+) Transcript_55246:2467-3822(+)